MSDEALKLRDVNLNELDIKAILEHIAKLLELLDQTEESIKNRAQKPNSSQSRPEPESYR